MKIGLDVMGGDYAPGAILEGAFDALRTLLPDERIVLIGDEEVIREIAKKENIDLSKFDLVPSEEVIEMGEHPARSFSQKSNSSIAVGYRLLKAGDIDGFASAGNTGAMLVGASYTVNVIPGVFRPALAISLPATGGGRSVLLDVGINPDCKPDVLLQYAKLGSLYARYVLDIDNPTVGLLNIGEEETKGTVAVRGAYELLKDNPSVNFKGNIEGNRLFTDDMTDVIVCDGFAGNVIIKQGEAFYSIYKERNIKKDEFFERLNFENFGGTPVVGINANVVIGHGISRRKAVMNMILQTRDVVNADLANKIIEEI
ncbi:MAG: phosphate--acyl-ACP acyltransferase [Bacteroidales bacterium]|nr:phosphate--acyl-ACP acyltransferase [Bacteroidales bacterium]